MPTGRIDVHSHLIPGVDDGCSSLEESMACARALVAAGYTHCFCTPHVWPSLPNNTADNIRQWTADLQAAYDHAHIPLRLHPGGEMNLRNYVEQPRANDLVTYGLAGKYVLMDLWADVLPDYFRPQISRLRRRGLTLILAHPERMRAFQDDPSLARAVRKMGVLLQGNLQCLGDPPESDARRLAELFLTQDHYFVLGSDIHALDTLPKRLTGLQRALDLVGVEKLDLLTKISPRQLLP